MKNDCGICGNGPVDYHAGMCVIGHPKVGDIVDMPKGKNPCKVYVCAILNDQGYKDRTCFKGSVYGPLDLSPDNPCDSDFMEEISS